MLGTGDVMAEKGKRSVVVFEADRAKNKVVFEVRGMVVGSPVKWLEIVRHINAKAQGIAAYHLHKGAWFDPKTKSLRYATLVNMEPRIMATLAGEILDLLAKY